MTDFDFESCGVDDEQQRLLKTYGFDATTFVGLRQQLIQGEFPSERNLETKPVLPPRPHDLTTLPDANSTSAVELEALGQEALRRGQVAAVVLNGGMATRFGGTVKGVVEVHNGQSFLALRLADVARASGSGPVFLMSSFATATDTLKHLNDRNYFGLDRERVCLFNQHLSIRLTPSGDVLRDGRGRASLYAPGHGDLFECLATTSAFKQFVTNGGKHIVVSNVDNIGATLSARVLGAHIRAGNAITVEVTKRLPNEPGGAPAYIDDHLQVVETFRFPKDFDINTIPVCSTNTMVMDVSAVRSDYPLTWFRVDKTVNGTAAVQFERLMGQATAFHKSTYLVVPREGHEGRFLPVKTPADLTHLREIVSGYTS